MIVDPRAYLDLVREAEQRRLEAEAICQRMAEDGECRVWLNGGILDPGSDEKTVITVYGRLSSEHRKLLMDAVMIVESDSKQSTPKEG